MAAEVLAQSGVAAHLFDAMPSVGRKFLLAGKGGLNLTHSEPHEPFARRYAARQPQIEPLIRAFGSPEVRAWAQGLGVETFVGTSGRVFPTDMKAAPLLRAWLHRLRGQGVQLHMRHRWLGWASDHDAAQAGQPAQQALDFTPSSAHVLRFATPAGECQVTCRAVVLALGGGSWARLGSDGAWVPLLAERGVAVAPLRPSNCGFDVAGMNAPAGETRRAFLQELLGRTPAVPVGSAGAAPPKPPRTAPPVAGARPEGIRLSKWLTDQGIASRREADDWIAAGWVRVDGEMAVLGQRVPPDAVITIDPRAQQVQLRRVTVLLHKLCIDTFQHSAPGACLEASVRHVFFPAQAVDLKDSPSAKAVADRHEAWKAELPKDDDALWDRLAALDDDRRTTLLALALGFISLGFLFRTFAHPIVGLATLAVVMLTYFGRVKFKGGLPGVTKASW